MILRIFGVGWTEHSIVRLAYESIWSKALHGVHTSPFTTTK